MLPTWRDVPIRKQPKSSGKSQDALDSFPGHFHRPARRGHPHTDTCTKFGKHSQRSKIVMIVFEKLKAPKMLVSSVSVQNQNALTALKSHPPMKH